MVRLVGSQSRDAQRRRYLLGRRRTDDSEWRHRWLRVEPALLAERVEHDGIAFGVIYEQDAFGELGAQGGQDVTP